MKKYPFQQITVMMMLLFPLLISCNKLRDIIHPGESSMPRDFQLKEMIVIDVLNNDRHFLFYYNKHKELDSLRRVDYRVDGTVTYTGVYQVSYKRNGCIDSVKLVEPGGVLISTGSNYEYDHYGRITRFDYQFWIGEGSPALPNYYIYNDATVIHGVEWPYMHEDTVLYNMQQNATNWYRSSSRTTYTHDQQLNPLFYVKQVGKISLEDGVFYEYSQSKHNITSRDELGLPQGELFTTFENSYDNKSRLIEQRLIGPFNNNQIFKFKYY